jgi:hypothetical protein
MYVSYFSTLPLFFVADAQRDSLGDMGDRKEDYDDLKYQENQLEEENEHEPNIDDDSDSDTDENSQSDSGFEQSSNKDSPDQSEKPVVKTILKDEPRKG